MRFSSRRRSRKAGQKISAIRAPPSTETRRAARSSPGALSFGAGRAAARECRQSESAARACALPTPMFCSCGRKRGSFKGALPVEPHVQKPRRPWPRPTAEHSAEPCTPPTLHRRGRSPPAPRSPAKPRPSPSHRAAYRALHRRRRSPARKTPPLVALRNSLQN